MSKIEISVGPDIAYFIEGTDDLIVDREVLEWLEETGLSWRLIAVPYDWDTTARRCDYPDADGVRRCYPVGFLRKTLLDDVEYAVLEFDNEADAALFRLKFG